MEQREQLLRDTGLFVLDMDGTFYLGDQILDGALDFIETVKKTKRKFLFFTNNSSKSPEIYMEKLAGMNCPIAREQIMTSGDVTIQYLKSHYPGQTVYLMGTPALEESFHKAGITLIQEKSERTSGGTPAVHPDIVVVGFDTTLTYEKLERACTYIREGALFLATHLDINCPTEMGFIPDCGVICAAIALSAGVQPKYLGKPFAETVEMVLERTGVERDAVAFVGDRLYTDIATGVKNGARGFLVLTGETCLADVDVSDVKPDGIFKSLGEMGEMLRKMYR